MSAMQDKSKKVQENFLEFLRSSEVHQLPNASRRYYDYGANPKKEIGFHNERRPEVGDNSEESIWRHTNQKWLFELLNSGKKIGREERFISFSSDKDSGGMDNFGDVIIEFDKEKVYDQGAIEIWYEKDFFDMYPKICKYITGYERENDYYEMNDFKGPEDANDNLELTWEQYIESYEHEEEIVIKEIKMEHKLIKSVKFEEDPKPGLIKLLKDHNISITFP